MGHHFKMVDFDAAYAALPTEPVLVNGKPVDTVKDREELHNLLVTVNEGDTLESIPSCKATDTRGCGETKGMANLGKRCGNCGHVVAKTFDTDLASKLWVMAPMVQHVDTVTGEIGERRTKLMNPLIWIILREQFSIQSPTKNSLIQWLTSPNYIPKDPDHKYFQILQQSGFERSWSFFMENYEEIITFLHKNHLGRGDKNDRKKRREVEQIYTYLMENVDVTFTDYLPIPNRVALITEKSNSGVYADKAQEDCLNAIRSICSITNAVIPMSKTKAENRIVKFQEQLSNYYDNVIKDVIGRKPGIARHHIFGSSLQLTARGVITSISDWHAYDETHFPWAMFLNLFRAHIASKLLKGNKKKGREPLTPNELKELMSYGANNYHPLLHEIIDELIDESPYRTQYKIDTDAKGNPVGRKGIPIILQRNPSLDRQSSQLLYITKVKFEDVHDNTIGMSVLVLKGPNADFDGDALNVLLVADRYSYENFMALSTHMGILDLHQPRSLAGKVSLPSPPASAVNNWLEEHEQELEDFYAENDGKIEAGESERLVTFKAELDTRMAQLPRRGAPKESANETN